jgi:hypothetical protein
MSLATSLNEVRLLSRVLVFLNLGIEDRYRLPFEAFQRRLVPLLKLLGWKFDKWGFLGVFDVLFNSLLSRVNLWK